MTVSELRLYINIRLNEYLIITNNAHDYLAIVYTTKNQTRQRFRNALYGIMGYQSKKRLIEKRSKHYISSGTRGDGKHNAHVNQRLSEVIMTL